MKVLEQETVKNGGGGHEDEADHNMKNDFEWGDESSVQELWK